MNNCAGGQEGRGRVARTWLKKGVSVLGTVRRDSLRSEDYNGSIILLIVLCSAGLAVLGRPIPKVG